MINWRFIRKDNLYNTDQLHPELPSSMSMFLNYWDDYYPIAISCHKAIKEGQLPIHRAYLQKVKSYWRLYHFLPVAGMAMLSGSMWKQPAETEA